MPKKNTSRTLWEQHIQRIQSPKRSVTEKHATDSIIEELPAWFSEHKVIYDFELDDATPSNNVIKNCHFFKYKEMRANFRKALSVQLLAYRPLPRVLPLSGLIVVRYSAGALDWDNAAGGLKPLQDCLVRPSSRNPDGLGLIEDDNPKCMPYQPCILQRKAEASKGKTRLMILDLSTP